MTGETNSQDLLETLDQNNLFVVALDQSRNWYRYHRLFSELLRNRLRLSGIPETQLHQKASQWYEDNAYVNDAIRHAVIAEEWEQAGNIILENNAAYLKRGEVQTVIGWFESLPEESLFSNPKLGFDYCWPLLLAGQFDTAAQYLSYFEKMAEDIPEFLGEVYAAQAYHALGKGDHKRMVERSQTALKLLPDDSNNARGIVAINLGLAYWHMGQMKAAEEVLRQALKAGQATQNHYVAMTALIFLGRVKAVRGQLHQAAEVFKQAIHEGGEIPINALAHMDLAQLHIEWDDLDESERHIQKSIALCERSRNYEFLVATRMIQSSKRIAEGDLSGAEESLAKAWETINQETISPPTVKRVNAAHVNFLLAKGQPLGEWADKLDERIDCHPFYRFVGLTKARTLPMSKALAYLDNLGKIASKKEWIYCLIAIRILQAHVVDSPDEALGYLSEALQLTEGERFTHSFMSLGDKLIPLLEMAVQQGIAVDIVHRLLAEVRGKKIQRVKSNQSSMIDPLSDRELEVLRLLATGMTNRQIAEQIVVSISTVKSHVHHICSKLDAENRTQAVALARQLDLL